MIDNNMHKKGFTLLVAIVTTSSLFVISFMVVNLAFKQLVISDASEQSQYAFYNADTGIECAIYWDLKTGPNMFNPSTKGNITCNGNVITPTVGEYSAGISVTNFTLSLVTGYADIEITKNQITDITTIESRGYNTSVAGALRKFERGVTISYTSPPPYVANIIWTNLVGVSQSGETLTKTAASGWGTGSAVSSNQITSGEGYIEFMTDEVNKYKMAGLNKKDGAETGSTYQEIDFAVMTDFGAISIFESGTFRGFFGTVVAGDVFKIAIEQDQVKYYKNNTLLYTSAIAITSSSYPFVFDTAFNTNGSTISNAKMGS